VALETVAGTVEVPAEGLRTQTLRAVKWTAFGQAMAVGLQIPYTILMSRLLTPLDFGIVGLASVLLRFVSYFAQLGVLSALVQAPSVSRDDYRASQGLSLLTGSAGGLAIAAAAVPMAHLTGKPPLEHVMQVLALDMPLTALGVAGTAALRRQLRFRSLALIEMSSFALGFLLVGSVSALLGARYWSLVIAALTASALRSLGVMVSARMPLSPKWAPRTISHLASFGRTVSLVYFLEFWSGSADSFMVGRNRPAADLGQYSRASLLVWLPTQQVGVIVSRVLLTSLRMRDRAVVGQVVANGLALLSGILLPLVSIFAISARLVVPALLGPQWSEAISLVPYVAVAALINTLTQLPSVACEAHGLLREKLISQMGQVVIMAGGLTATTAAGASLRWYAITWIAGEAVRHCFYAGVLRQRFELSLRSLCADYTRAGVATIPAALVAATSMAASGSAPLRWIGVAASLLALGCTWHANPSWPVRRAMRRLALLPVAHNGRLFALARSVLA
jgi:lipopolysaccharide exporter